MFAQSKPFPEMMGLVHQLKARHGNLPPGARSGPDANERDRLLENTALFVEVAAELGIRGILHTDTSSTRAKLNALGLEGSEQTGGQR